MPHTLGSSERVCSLHFGGGSKPDWMLQWATCSEWPARAGVLDKMIQEVRSHLTKSVILQMMRFQKLWHFLYFLSSFILSLSENEMFYGSVPLSPWWMAVVGFCLVAALRAAAAPLRNATPELQQWTENWWKTLKWDRIEELNKQKPKKNPTKISLLPSVPWRLVLFFRL